MATSKEFYKLPRSMIQVCLGLGAILKYCDNLDSCICKLLEILELGTVFLNS